LYVPRNTRIVIPESVVPEPCLDIVVLPWETNIQPTNAVLLNTSAISLVVSLPHCLLAGVRSEFRPPQMIGVYKVNSPTTVQAYKLAAEPKVVRPSTVRQFRCELILPCVVVAARACVELRYTLALGIEHIVCSGPIDVSLTHPVEGAVGVGLHTRTTRLADPVTYSIVLVLATYTITGVVQNAVAVRINAVLG